MRGVKIKNVGISIVKPLPYPKKCIGFDYLEVFKDKNITFGELVVLFAFMWLVFQCVYTDNVYNVGHNIFMQMGIVDEINKLDEYVKGWLND